MLRGTTSFLPRYRTVWKFQNFSVPLILREINFEESSINEIAIFANLEALIFANLVNFSSSKSAKIHKLDKIKASKCVKKAAF